MYACVQELCSLWVQSHFDTFHQLPNIVDVLWSQPVLEVGKWVVVVQSEIRAVRRMVKQLQVEMLQWCSSVSSCMRTCIIMEEHYTMCHRSMPFVLDGWPYAVLLAFHNTLQTLLWSLVAWIPPSALLSCPVQENSCHQLSGTQTTFF
jgi:hypothetical protein